MRSAIARLLSAATTVIGLSGTALGLSGCSSQDQSTSLPLTMTPPPPATPSIEPGPLPAPDALADVMYRLADPAVPGSAKLDLVADTAPPDVAALDGFAAALRDTGFTPVTVTAADLRWSPAHPGEVLATIRIATADRENPGEFSFPMEFDRSAAGWQLTRETADMLLAFGDARAAVGPAPAPTTPPP